jgi:NAD+ synthase
MSDEATVWEAETPLDMHLAPDELAARREHISSFIQDQVAGAGVDGVVLGLSGGVDSTLTAYLAVEALGRDAVYGLVMPSEVNREANMSDAERIASELLDIEYEVIGIEPIIDAVRSAYPEAGVSTKAVGNLRVRIRAVLCYLAANMRDRLVLGTGNRSEALVGYFTKYGDGAVDCHPIANLYKGQVRQLAAEMGAPEGLAQKEASAEMWVDQTDEAEMGLTYRTLDSILALHIEGGLSKTATAAEIGVETEAVQRVRTLHEQSAHKRQVPPRPERLS